MRVAVILFGLLPGMLWAGDVPLASRVTAVALYPQGATVTREASFDLPAGRHELILADLPRTTPLASVRVAVAGVAMGSVTVRDAYVPPRDGATDAALEAARAEVDRLEAALRDGEARVAEIELEAAAADARVAFLRQIGEGEGVAGLDVGTLRDLSGMIGEEVLAALRAGHEAERRADAADRGLEALREDLAAARQALKALVPETEARAMLAVAVTAAEAVQGRVTVSYVTDRAGWLPVYDLKLDRGQGRLEIGRGAFLRQATGENWRDVELTLSTRRPAEQSAPSDIWPWLRRIVDPREEAGKALVRPGAEAADLGVQSEEPVFAAPAPETAHAAFDGLSVTYSHPAPVSVATGADRVRLDLGTRATGADMVAQAVPLGDSHAYLMARITNDTGEPILPTGEARFYLDGHFVGQRPLAALPAGAETALAFGPVEGLRLTRIVPARSEGDRGLLSKTTALSETVTIEVENLTGESWPLRVLDRVPFSEQDDLRIAWQAEPHPVEQDVDGRRGVLAWEFDLPAGESRAIRLSHDLRWPEGMVLR